MSNPGLTDGDRLSVTGLPGPYGVLALQLTGSLAFPHRKRAPFVPYSDDAILDLERLSSGTPTICSMVPSLAPSALSNRPDQLCAIAGLGLVWAFPKAVSWTRPECYKSGGGVLTIGFFSVLLQCVLHALILSAPVLLNSSIQDVG